MRVIILFLLGAALGLALSHCDDSRTGPAKMLGGGWSRFPIQVDVSEDLSLCQRAALNAAVAFWETTTETRLFDVHVVPENTLSVSGLPPYGHIGVSAGRLSAPNVLDDTTLQWNKLGALHSADVRLGKCHPRAYSHELGHSLGLGDVEGGPWLMARVHDGDAWNVDPSEVEAILGSALLLQ